MHFFSRTLERYYYISQYSHHTICIRLLTLRLLKVVAQHVQWQRLCPRVEPFYAVKCNNDPAILQTLALLGTGFDCASRAEIDQVLQMGVSPERIIFANPCKIKSHVEFAKQKDVAMMTFDDEHELEKIKKIYPDAKLVLRILPPPTKASRT